MAIVHDDATAVPERGQPDEVRHVRRGGWTHVDNDLFHAGLSARAIGLCVLMLSKPPGWRFSSTRLAAEVAEGRDAIRTAMRELIEAGFVFLDHIGGDRPRTVFYVREARDVTWPDVENLQVGSCAWESGAGNSGAGFSGRDVSTERAITEVVIKTSAHPADEREGLRDEPSFAEPKPTPSRSSPRFDDFWKLYPRRTGKGEARKQWDRLTATGMSDDDILAGLRRRVEWWTKARTPLQMIPYPATWLNQHRWLDEIEPVPATVAASMAQRQADHDARQLDEVEAAIAAGNAKLAWKIICDKAHVSGDGWFAEISQRLAEQLPPHIVCLAVQRDGRPVTLDEVNEVIALRAEVELRSSEASSPPGAESPRELGGPT